MSSGAEWRSEEIAMVDASIIAGIRASQCANMFPGRSASAIKMKFTKRRDKLGMLGSPGRPSLPVIAWQPGLTVSAEAARAVEGSRRLREAIDAMFARKAKAHGVSFTGAKLATLYSHEQLQRMARVGLSA